MQIRRALPDDAPAIAQIYVENWKMTYSGLLPADFLDALSEKDKEEVWRSYILLEDRRVFVAEDEGDVLGFAACMPDEEREKCLYFDSLHVAQRARGRGVGGALIRRVGRFGREQGFAHMTICIVRGNDNAREIYLHHGARHEAFFTDHFGETPSNSERLIWDSLDLFAPEP